MHIAQNALVAKGWITRSFGAENYGFWRRNSDLDINPKKLDEQLAGGVAVIGLINNKVAHIPVNLIQKLW